MNDETMPFATQPMASGARALILEPDARWEEFPALARHWLERLQATPLGEPIISANECLWPVQIDDGTFWISYDDRQQGIHLEPQEVEYTPIILALQQQLRAEPHAR